MAVPCGGLVHGAVLWVGGYAGFYIGAIYALGTIV